MADTAPELSVFSASTHKSKDVAYQTASEKTKEQVHQKRGRFARKRASIEERFRATKAAKQLETGGNVLNTNPEDRGSAQALLQKIASFSPEEARRQGVLKNATLSKAVKRVEESVLLKPDKDTPGRTLIKPDSEIREMSEGQIQRAIKRFLHSSEVSDAERKKFEEEMAEAGYNLKDVARDLKARIHEMRIDIKNNTLGQAALDEHIHGNEDIVRGNTATILSARGMRSGVTWLYDRAPSPIGKAAAYVGAGLRNTRLFLAAGATIGGAVGIIKTVPGPWRIAATGVASVAKGVHEYGKVGQEHVDIKGKILRGEEIHSLDDDVKSRREVRKEAGALKKALKGKELKGKQKAILDELKASQDKLSDQEKAALQRIAQGGKAGFFERRGLVGEVTSELRRQRTEALDEMRIRSNTIADPLALIHGRKVLMLEILIIATATYISTP